MSDMGTTSYVTSGDMVTLKAYIEDHTPIKMFANFSGILPVEGQENVEGSCTEMTTESEDYSAFLNNKRKVPNARFWECVWEVGPVVTVPRDITRLWANTTILFSIEDLLGNKAFEEYDLPILGEENVTANYWRYKWLSQSPTQGLDRFIWGIAQPTSFQHFTITPAPGAPSGDNLEIISFDFDTTTCSGDIDYVYYSDSGTAGITYMGFSPEIKYGIDDVIMMAFNPTNVPPATYADLHNVSHPLVELRINCTAKIISKVYGAKISLPEEENVTLKVKVFNNPLGTNIGNVKDEINDVQEHIASAGWGAIKYPRIIFDYAQIACNLVSTIQSVLGVLAFVGIIEGSACAEYQVMCPPSVQTNDRTGELATVQKGWLGKISVFCGLVISCRATRPQAIDGVDEQPDGSFKCSDADSTWCSIQLWWAEWSNGVISWLSGSALLETNEDLNKYMNQNPSQAETAAGGRNLSGNMPFMTSSDIRGGFDPKKSLIASTLSLCVPGILSNIEKYRQLRCEWLICVKVNVAYGDMTLSQCDDLFQYGLCKYILGDIWNAVPMFQFINQLLSSVGNLVKDPIALGGYVIDLLCANSCGGFPGPGCGVCTAFQFMNVLTQIVASIYGMADADFWTAPTNDICDEAVKDEPKYSNLPGFPAEADPAQQTPPEDTGAAA
ncbi:hypothetical protein HZB90_04220 [archaeon]|nr:hypothetical protein [archaeon]